MAFSGVVKYIEINGSGLESVVQLDFGNIIGDVNCYMLLAESCKPYCSVDKVPVYIEDREPSILKVSDIRVFELSVVFVCNCSKVEFGMQENVKQTINKSSHAEFVATVKKVIDKYTVICSIGKLGGNILVEFETAEDYLVEEDQIVFSGEIKAELVN